MAGIYLHIPFCKQRCHYCDFYKTTQVKKKPELVLALVKEIEQRKEYFSGEEVNTIYFGGGTPSLLSQDELSYIFDAIYKTFKVDDKVEITLESNPDDLSAAKLKELKNSRVNRLSIGIQSFQNEQLKKMNRRHNSHQAIECVKTAQDLGFKNISTDLIYGLPDLDLQAWEQDLEQMAQLSIQHLSAYHLTYEEGTVYDTMRKKGALKPILENESLDQFKALIAWAEANDMEHYEISNFAQKGLYSRHNTSYWQQKKYLGIGPSAHSYDLNNRSWNVANLNKYLQGLANNEPIFEHEKLSVEERFNEYLMTTLRTMWGIDIDFVTQSFGKQKADYLHKQIEPFIKSNQVALVNGHYQLSKAGVFISDAILTDLMWID